MSIAIYSLATSPFLLALRRWTTT